MSAVTAITEQITIILILFIFTTSFIIDWLYYKESCFQKDNKMAPIHHQTLKIK